MGRYVLKVDDWAPPTLNSVRGRHWSIEYQAKKHAAEMLAFTSWQQDVPRASVRRRVSLTVTLAGRMKQPDADAFDKILLDALVLCGLLLDDSHRGLAGRMKVKFRRGRPACTKIILEDVA